MRSINKVTLLGNLLKDAELITLRTNKESGEPNRFCKFCVVTNRSWKDKKGVWQEAAEFNDVILWGVRGEQASEKFKRGDLVYVEGHLKRHTKEDATGQKRYYTEIVVDEAINLGKRRREEEAGAKEVEKAREEVAETSASSEESALKSAVSDFTEPEPAEAAKPEQGEAQDSEVTKEEKAGNVSF